MVNQKNAYKHFQSPKLSKQAPNIFAMPNRYIFKQHWHRIIQFIHIKGVLNGFDLLVLLPTMVGPSSLA